MSTTTESAIASSGALSPLRLGVWRRRVNPLLLDRIMDTEETRRIRTPGGRSKVAPACGDTGVGRRRADAMGRLRGAES